MRARARDWPHGMTATATHDTKRGEDARARLMALSEIPGEWTSAVARWKLLNAPHLVTSGAMRAPSATFEYLLYQSLLGAWPSGAHDPTLLDRLQAFALKAAREGKQETSWLNPNAAYEAGLMTFIARILDPTLAAEFLASLDAFAKRLSLLGALNSLSQLTLKATMPGVPDFYQGTEFWDLSLVDPDNRRPVDFTARAKALAELRAPNWDALTRDWANGHVKLAWTAHLLKLRAEHADVFTDGDYQPIEVTGPHQDHLIAFARRRGRDAVITVATRCLAPLTDAGRHWPRADAFDARLDLRDYVADGIDDHNEAVAVSTLFKQLPVAVLRAGSKAPRSAYESARPPSARDRLASFILGQQQPAAIADRRLRQLREALQQPGQRDLQLDVIVRNIQMPEHRLPHRADAERHVVALPALLVDMEHGKAGRRAASAPF